VPNQLEMITYRAHLKPRQDYAEKIWKYSFIAVQLSLPSTLIRHEDERCSNRRNLNMLALLLVWTENILKMEIFENVDVTIERFSIECRKTKTRVITLANHKRQIIKWTNQNTKKLHVADAKRGKTRTSDSRLVLVLLLIGWKGGANFLNQWCGVVNTKPITFRYSNENRSNLAEFSSKTNP